MKCDNNHAKEKVMWMKMAMLVLLVCLAILGGVRAEEIIVKRHFKGDLFSKRGKSNQELT